MKRFAFLVSVLLAASCVPAAAENDGPPVGPLLPGGVGAGTAMLYAVVDANGTLNRSSGAASVVKAGVGNYRVIFRRNVRRCAYVATIGLSGASGTETNSSIDVVGDALDTKGVFVDTEDFAGNQVDRGFHLIVFCDN